MKITIQKVKYESNLNPRKPTPKMESPFEKETHAMIMDLESMKQRLQAYQALLEQYFLLSKNGLWNLNIQVYLEEELEEEGNQ